MVMVKPNKLRHYRPVDRLVSPSWFVAQMTAHQKNKNTLKHTLKHFRNLKIKSQTVLSSVGWWWSAEVAEPRVSDLSDDKCRGVPCQQSCDAAVGSCICHDGYKLVGTRCEGSTFRQFRFFLPLI